MASEIYDFPGGVCPICEHSPLNVKVTVNDSGSIFVSWQCPNPDCGSSEQVSKTKNISTDIRNTKLQSDWARRVKERDGYACVMCGSTSNLDAHHIISAGRVPEVQDRIGNGLTLCRRCHKLVHNNSSKWPEKYR